MEPAQSGLVCDIALHVCCPAVQYQSSGSLWTCASVTFKHQPKVEIAENSSYVTAIVEVRVRSESS